jgi:N-methylhydantoinase B
MANLRLILNPDIPRNGGAVRAVKLVVPEGTLLRPTLPAAVASRGATLGRQADLMQGAEAKIAPDKMMACPSGIDTLINFGGYDEKGDSFICMETIWGGWGGRPFADGVDYCTIPHQNISNQPCEVNEELYPIMYNHYAYLIDGEGAGKYRGSVAMVREWKLLVDDVVMSLRVDRQRFNPYGLYGGEPGAFLEPFLNPEKENRRLGKTTMTLKKGDVIRLHIAGAGGWGNPLERDINALLEDVRLGKISLKRAREAYGVVINEDTMEVDMAKTKSLRETMQKQRDTEQRDKEIFRFDEFMGPGKCRVLRELIGGGS